MSVCFLPPPGKSRNNQCIIRGYDTKTQVVVSLVSAVSAWSDVDGVCGAAPRCLLGHALGQFCAGTGEGNTAQYTARACIDGIDANAEYVGCRDVLKTVFAPHQAHN